MRQSPFKAIDPGPVNWAHQVSRGLREKLQNADILIGSLNDRLTNARYADDVLLYAKSLDELRKMTELLIIELRSIGLNSNAGQGQGPFEAKSRSEYGGGANQM